MPPRTYLQPAASRAPMDVNYDPHFDTRGGFDPRYSSANFDGSSSSVLTVLASLFKFKGRMIAIFTIVFLIAIAYALSLRSGYKAHAAMLATMSADYAVRPDAGSHVQASGMLEESQIVRTEQDILNNDELHRAVIAKIGPQTLYPDLFKKPTGVKWLVTEVKDLPRIIRTSITGQSGPKAPSDPVEKALPVFDAHFSTDAAHDSTVINLTFSHPNAKMAAHVLNVLMAEDTILRRKLYSSPQAKIVEARVTLLRQRVDRADAALNAYKAQHGIGDFAAREKDLEDNRAKAEQELAKTIGLEAQNKARITTLTAELHRLAPTVVTQRIANSDVALDPENRTVNTLRETLDKLQATYRPTSPVVRRVRAQLEAAERAYRQRSHSATSNVQTAQNPVFLKASQDLLQASDDLNAATAYHAKLDAYLTQINGQIQQLTSVDADLTRLTQNRSVAIANYQEGMKELSQRRLLDEVDARKETSVRTLEAAVTPLLPVGVRRLIAIAGLVLAVILGGLVGLLSNYWRSYYISADEVEADIGLPVLARITPIAAADLPPLIQGGR